MDKPVDDDNTPNGSGKKRGYPAALSHIYMVTVNVTIPHAEKDEQNYFVLHLTFKQKPTPDKMLETFCAEPTVARHKYADFIQRVVTWGINTWGVPTPDLAFLGNEVTAINTIWNANFLPKDAPAEIGLEVGGITVFKKKLN